MNSDRKKRFLSIFGQKRSKNYQKTLFLLGFSRKFETLNFRGGPSKWPIWSKTWPKCVSASYLQNSLRTRQEIYRVFRDFWPKKNQNDPIFQISPSRVVDKSRDGQKYWDGGLSTSVPERLHFVKSLTAYGLKRLFIKGLECPKKLL